MSSIISTKASSALNNLRLLMVFAIVCQHSRIDQDITNGNAASFIKYCCNFEFPHDFVCHLFHPAVPILFILSGYLFFFNIDNFGFNEYKKKLLGRVNSLLIPFLIWTAIGIVATPFLYKKEVTFLYIIESLTTNPIGVLWYLRDLIVIALMSPIYYYIVKKVKIGGGILTFVIISLLFPNKNFIFFNIYFFLGAAVAINKIKIEDVLKIIDYRLCILIFILWKFLTVYYQTEIILPFKSVIILIGLLGFFMNTEINFKDSGFSTFLYLTHPYAKAVKSIIVMFIPLSNDINCILVLITRIILTTALCLILYKAIPKNIRSVLIGGR